ncbi:MAG TPA: hypothetical protein VIS56_02415 [Candidatus Saccharimonadales bacterium]
MIIEEQKNHVVRSKRLSRKLYWLILLVVVGAIAWFGRAYWQTHTQLTALQSDPAVAARQESKDLVDAVGKLIVLPDESPAIATVDDKDKLTSQAFFKNAANGDKVLMYAEAKKAILYRPSVNKVLEVAYLNIDKKP